MAGSVPTRAPKRKRDADALTTAAPQLDTSQAIPGLLNDVVINKVGAPVQSWDAGATLACVVLALLVCCCLIGTLLQHWRRSTPAIAPSTTTAEPLTAGASATQEPATDGSVNDAASSEKPKRSAGWVRTQAFFAHFDVTRNTSRMVAVPEAQPSQPPHILKQTPFRRPIARVPWRSF